MRKKAALVAAAAVTSLAAAGCSSPPNTPSISAIHRAQGQAAARALDVGHRIGAPARQPVVRLGFTVAAGDATALTALALGYPGQQLGSQVQLQPQRYTSAATETAALGAGRLDAAYITPADAVAAWRASSGAIVIISGAAITHGAGRPRPAVVLAVTRALLTRHPAWADGLLKSQVLANQLINTNRVAATQATATEFAALGHKITLRKLSAALGRYTYTCDPGAASLLAQVHVSAISRLLDLAPLNALLRATGQLPVRS